MFQNQNHKLIIASLSIMLMIGALTASAQVTNTTVIIDASTTQPINTGLATQAVGDAYIVMAEGAIQRVNDLSRYTSGWINPNGETRLDRFGEPASELPYGALGYTYSQLYSYTGYVGSQGVVDVSGAVSIGAQLHLFLNMSDTDLAGASGQIVAHIMYLPDGTANQAEILIDGDSGNPVSTGLVCASTNENFIILPYGALRRFDSDPYARGWFGPAGYADYGVAGMPKANGAFGALMGSFDPNGNLDFGFYIQDGGTFSTQPVDVGDELFVGVNMPAEILDTCSGQFHVNVIQVTDPALAAAPGLPASPTLGQAYPNPMNPSTTIDFSLAADDDVLLRIYDVSGRWVRTLVQERRVAGDHQVKWDGIDDQGLRVASGAYLYQLSTSQGSQTGRVAVVK